jgi:hypothetical protein
MLYCVKSEATAAMLFFKIQEPEPKEKMCSTQTPVKNLKKWFLLHAFTV